MDAIQIQSPVPDYVFDIIAEEVGVSKTELFDGSDFTDFGIDDLLARSIVTRITETLKFNLHQSALTDYRNAKELHDYIVLVSRPPTPESLPEHAIKILESPFKEVKAATNLGAKLSSQHKHERLLPLSQTLKKRDPNIPFNAAQKPPKNSLSLLLQNKPSNTSRILFLLPDGSGSGMAYARLPAISPDVCLIGMNSPFLTNPTSKSSGSIEELIPYWVQEIRSRQPHGPYFLGGWSAGGYYSFEVAKKLVTEGEIVGKLILIDSPCRLVFEALPMEVIHYLAQENLLGNWGKSQAPEWFVQHFERTIRAVEDYMPTPLKSFAGGKGPEVYILWSSDGVLNNLDNSETGLDLSLKVTRFLIENRKDFGTHGWEGLFEKGTKIQIAKLPGNHFTIVHPPNCKIMSDLLRDVLRDDGARENNWQLVQV